ncbi:MAG TPA: hypothetical protein VEX15_21525 [Nocardioidaceae bacterium]|nr:hypothetical protein [Nocardioidaceae bacterium]
MLLDSGGGGGGGTGYPWPHYTATPGDVNDDGDAINKTSQTIHNTMHSVDGSHRPAQAATAGDVQAPMATAPQPVLANGNKVATAALLAGGSVVQWSHHITDHNGGVDKINRAFEAEQDNDFGVAAADYSDAKTAQDRADVDSDRSSAVAAAYSTRQAVYQKKYDGLVDNLDGDATTVSSTLDEGPTEAAIKKLLLAGALPALALSLFPDMKLTKAEYHTLLANLRNYNELKQFLTPTCGSSEDLKRQLDAARAMGLKPREYKDLLQMYWVTRAAEKAGIDLCAWDPSKGAEGLRGIIEAVYTYYGKLYLDNPYMQWAGMANMIGPSFAGGFFDLNMLRNIADGLGNALDKLPYGAGGAFPGILGDIGSLGAHLTADDIKFFETTFLQMQKDIFFDQAAMHQAYLDGGMDAIAEMRDAGLFDNGDPDQTYNAWSQIDEGRRTGNNELITAGNEYLLYREQHDIIDDSYQTMKDHPVTGEAVTYLMGAVGQPSIPGAQGLGDVSPLKAEIPVTVGIVPSMVHVEVETPLPNGNIADFDTRWNLIEKDTLPAYQHLINDDPERAREIIGSNVHDRIEDGRLVHRVDDITEDLLTDWHVRARFGF